MLLYHQYVLQVHQRVGFSQLTAAERLYAQAIQAEIDDLTERLDQLRAQQRQLLTKGRVRRHRGLAREHANSSERPDET